MTSWYDVAQRAEPIQGHAAYFQMAVGYWRGAAQKADTVTHSFDRILGQAPEADLQGEAAKAVTKLLSETKKLLGDVPAVCTSVADILDQHAKKLVELKSAADQALARAATAWEGRKTAASDEVQSKGRLASLQRQLNQLQAQPPEQVATQVTTLEHQISTENTTLASARHRYNSHQGDIDRELVVWDTVHSSEHTAEQTTAQALRAVDLHSLANPNLLHQAGAAVSKVFNAFVDGLKKGLDVKGWIDDLGGLISALAHGDFKKALWKLHDIIDRAISLLTVVIMVVVIVVAVVAALPTGGASLAGAAAFLGAMPAVMAGLSAGKLALDLLIMKVAPTNPETGEQMTWATIGADTIGVLLSVLGLKLPKLPAAGATNLAGYTASRATLAENGIVLKYGWNASVKTIPGVAKSQLKEATKGLVDTSGHTLADGSGEPRLAPVDEGVRKLLNPQRGIDAPVDTYLVGTY